MATMTISYDGRSKVAQNVVALIRSLGDVFHITMEQPKTATEVERTPLRTEDYEWTAEEEREAFLYTSKMNTARWLEKNDKTL